MTIVVHTIDELVNARLEFNREEKSIGFVATMGALHAGHLSLLDAASSTHDEVIISIFVNPLQFGSAHDLSRYPRQLEKDIALATRAGATLVFAPSESQMFPAGQPIITVDPGALGSLLEGSSRPRHMSGVATIVTKLLSLTRADHAYFGEKDFEQLTLIRRLVTDLGLGVGIVGMPIIREADGLALSSRNTRLSDEERRRATVLYRALEAGGEAVRAGCVSLVELEGVMSKVVGTEPEVVLNYATAREEESFSLPESLDGKLRLLIAAHVGPVRLIDNLAVKR
jgi:pantoate--beta-alanine ligase